MSSFLGLLFFAALGLSLIVIVQLFTGGADPALASWTVGAWIALFIVSDVQSKQLKAKRTKKYQEWQANRAAKAKEIHRYSSELVNQHLQVLKRKRLTGCTTDDYGIVSREKWDRELDYFENVVLMPELQKRWENQHIEYAFVELSAKDFIDQIVLEADTEANDFRSLPEGISSVEFEGICASILNKKGWSATLTPQTGDQGADVKALKDGISLVLQCKLYNSPVGNKAVQEVLAAKVYYGADLAAVVTTSSYTSSAQELAQVSDVRLLTYDEFLDADFGQQRTAKSLSYPGRSPA